MAVAEIITTKTECFKILENGCIIRTKGKFEPTKYEYDVYEKPEFPKVPGDSQVIFCDRFGNEQIRFNKERYEWALQCECVALKNYMARQEQRKAFKKRIAEIRKRYYRQEALRKKEERRKIYRQGMSVVRSFISYMVHGRVRS